MNGFELSWGIPVIGYLFLAGVGAGALTTSSSMLLRGGPTGRYFNIARYGAFLASPLVIIGTGLLVLDLGSFQTGHWFKFINLFKVINLSPMSIGTWLLTFFILIGIPYGYTFLSKDAAPGDRFDRLRRLLAWISVPLGLAVAIYTGVLLGAMPARPFWNSPIIALLFMISSLSTGMAILVLTNTVLNRDNPDPEFIKQTHETNYILNVTDTIFIGFELLVIFLFIMYAHLTVGDPKAAITVIEWGGELSIMFWLGVVVVGLLVPGAIELFQVIPRVLNRETYIAHAVLYVVVPVCVLLGGYLLRHVFVVAGQITGPIGL